MWVAFSEPCCVMLRTAQDPTDRTPGDTAKALLSLLECITVNAASMPAVLTALASGMFAHLAGWAIKITQHAPNLRVRRQAL